MRETSCIGRITHRPPWGPDVQWVEHFVDADRTCSIDPAPEALIREHALRSGFPADQVNRISRIIDPTTAE